MNPQDPQQNQVPPSPQDVPQQPQQIPPAQYPQEVPQQPQMQPVQEQLPPQPLPEPSPQQAAPAPMPEPEFEQPEAVQQAPDEHIEWQASEYIHHEKNFGWYALFFMATTFVMAIMFLILRDILSVIVIGLMAVALAIFANRKPRVLNYAINADGVSVGDHNYSYESFRSFSVIEDGGMQTIVVDPMQKFLPPITIYCEPQDVNRIVEVLSFYLPHEDMQLDWVDRFAKRIRF